MRYDYYRDYETRDDRFSDKLPVVIYPQKRKRRFIRSLAALFMSVAVGGVSLGLGVGLGIGYFDSKSGEGDAAYAKLQAEIASLLEAQVRLEDSILEFADSNDIQTDSRSQYLLTALTSSTTFDSVSDIFKSVRDSVVSINMQAQSLNFFNRLQEYTGAGSGIIFDEDTEKIYIVTNYHVIDSATKVTISLDDKTEVNANYVGGDSRADLAVISVNKTDLAAAGVNDYKVAKFGDSDKIEVGNAVIAIGNALGEGKSATFGIISTEQKTISIEGSSLEVIQTDAAINPGNSGGALVNTSGEVIGINTAKLSSSGVEGMGYAIPSNIAISLIEDIMKSGMIERPYLGIEFQALTEDDVTNNNLPSGGIYIYSVGKNSTAANAGVKQGDIITAINGKAIMTETALSEMINSIKIGEDFTITVLRLVSSGRYIFGQSSSTVQEYTLEATMQNYGSELSF